MPIRSVLVAMAMMFPLVQVSTAAPPDGCPRTIYLSTGDHQDILGTPLDSQISIETAFDTLKNLYGAERIWWRGGQDHIWAEQFVLRSENRFFDRIWAWWRHLQFEKVNTNRIAVEVARKQGLKIWMLYGLFDNGSGPDVAFSGFPYAMEDKLRIAHPEIAPLNRWGTWRQGGPIEFAYEDARTGMVEYLARHIRNGGYDGIAFLTYAENYSQRYESEFGFNAPIVAEYKKRYGVDIRTQDFDRQKWSQLRGEYLTQFFRELKTALGQQGPKIAVCVDGKDPQWPTLWGDTKARSAGLIHMDVATWAKEGIVDEVSVWAPPDDEAKSLTKCQEMFAGTACVAGAFRTRGYLPAGTPRTMFLGFDFENGFPWENWIDFADENIPVQPADALRTGDSYARRQLLMALLRKKQTLPTSEIAIGLKDQDLYVRRLALRVLAESGDAAAIPAVETALRDPEHSIRLKAVVSLAQLGGSEIIGTLLDAVERDADSFQMCFKALPESLLKLNSAGKLTQEAKQAAISRLKHENVSVRESILYSLLRVGAPATKDAEEALSLIVDRDPSLYAREMALENLRSSFGATPSVMKAVSRGLADDDAAVQVRAMTVFARLQSTAEAPQRGQALKQVTEFFHGYGEGTQRRDRDWGWRLAGEALLAFGADGEKVLQQTMQEKSNRRLAEIAWRLLYLKQSDKFYTLTEAEDREAHAHHPFFKELGK